MSGRGTSRLARRTNYVPLDKKHLVQIRLVLARGNEPPATSIVNADSVAEAIALVRNAGYLVVDAQATRSATNVLGSFLARKRAGDFSETLFAQQLAALLNAGLGVIESLNALAAQAESETRTTLEGLVASLRKGDTLSDALTLSGAASPLFISLIRASEHTSDLAAALRRYLDYARQIDEVKQRVVSASIYPALLAGVGSLVMIFLLAWVVPRFATIFESMQGELPWTARLLMHWGRLVADHGGLMLLGFLSLAAGGFFLFSQARVRGGVYARVLAWGRLGAWLQRFHFARLYRTIGMLLSGGIPLVRAIDMALPLLPEALRSRALLAVQQIRRGDSVASAFERQALATPVGMQMLAVGERTGDLGGMMTRIAEFEEGDLARALEKGMRAFEPLLMTLIGVGIGLVVVLMYMPIFELASAIK
jgi:general secretion pathway protein F